MSGLTKMRLRWSPPLNDGTANLIAERRGLVTPDYTAARHVGLDATIGHEVIEVSVGLGCCLILFVLAAHYDLQRIIR
jgi:hypothetical protein